MPRKKIEKKAPAKTSITVAEAGRKGGRTVRERYGHEFYVAIGTKGGGKVKELIAAGRAATEAAAPKAKKPRGKKAEA